MSASKWGHSATRFFFAIKTKGQLFFISYPSNNCYSNFLPQCNLFSCLIYNNLFCHDRYLKFRSMKKSRRSSQSSIIVLFVNLILLTAYHPKTFFLRAGRAIQARSSECTNRHTFCAVLTVKHYIIRGTAATQQSEMKTELIFYLFWGSNHTTRNNRTYFSKL